MIKGRFVFCVVSLFMTVIIHDIRVQTYTHTKTNKQVFFFFGIERDSCSCNNRITLNATEIVIVCAGSV